MKEAALLTGEKHEMHSVAVQDGVFVSFFSKAQQRGCGIHWQHGCFTEAAFQKATSQIKGYFGGLESEDLEVKLVGPSLLADQATRIIHRFGLKLGPKSVRPSGKAEIRFHPRSGRLQVAWDERSKEAGLEKTRVLIVDDSATIRKLLKSTFEASPDFEVVGCAELPSQVEALIQSTKPNVITLDIHMPEQDGVSLLKQIYPKYKIPAVMITSVSRDEGPLVLEALDSGAVDYIQKPSISDLRESTSLIIERVCNASKTKFRSRTLARRLASAGRAMDRESIVAIGSSTGGTEALKEILIRLPETIPPTVIVQHIPAIFSDALAKRLDGLCSFHVKEAADGDRLLPNQVLIAPGGKQMRVEKAAQGFKVVVYEGDPVNRHKPSVDVLFESVAKEIGRRAIGVILTGMGGDGARGLLSMKNAGARTIAQNEETCVVFGMPREAIKLGAAQEICPLEGIPELLMSWLDKGKKAS